MGRKAKVFPNTKYSFEEYRELALDLYHRRGYKPAQIREKLGTPFWEGKQWHIDYKKGDDQFFQRQTLESKQGAAISRKADEVFVDDDVRAWADRLTKEKKWPKGKSLEDFERIEKGLETKYLKNVDKLRDLDLPGEASDGHIVSLKNKNLKATPLEKLGQGGSHSPRARIPELLDANKGKSKSKDLPKYKLRKAGIPTTPSEAFAQYLTGDQGTGVHLGTKDKQRINLLGENPDKVIADRYNYVQGKKIEAANKKHMQAVEIAKNYKVTKVIDKAKPVLKTAGKALPVVGLTIAGGILYTDVTKAAENPSAKNYAKVGLSTFDTVVEGIDTATLGLATPVTMALNLGTELARYQLDHGTASSSERDWDARIASRRGNN